MHSTRAFLSLLFAALLPAICLAQKAPSNSSTAGQNPSYRILVRDQVQVTVFDEPELSTAQRVDGKGQLRIPLLGNVKISGLTIRDAEESIEHMFVEGEFLKEPMVTVKILEYAPREASVFGAVRSPGTIPFPIEVNSMDIVDVISKTGGFTGIAKGKTVKVTRLNDAGDETVFNVNVEAFITGQGRSGSADRFLIYPGDVIYVDDKLF